MKEASGVLYMTVVTVVAIAAVAAFFYAFIWPGIQQSIERSTYCATASCGECTDSSNGKQKCQCTYTDKNGEEKEIECEFQYTEGNAQ